jgi:hypothetical protein
VFGVLTVWGVRWGLVRGLWVGPVIWGGGGQHVWGWFWGVVGRLWGGLGRGVFNGANTAGFAPFAPLKHPASLCKTPAVPTPTRLEPQKSLWPPFSPSPPTRVVEGAGHQARRHQAADVRHVSKQPRLRASGRLD